VSNLQWPPKLGKQSRKGLREMRLPPRPIINLCQRLPRVRWLLHRTRKRRQVRRPLRCLQRALARRAHLASLAIKEQRPPLRDPCRPHHALLSLLQQPYSPSHPLVGTRGASGCRFSTGWPRPFPQNGRLYRRIPPTSARETARGVSGGRARWGMDRSGLMSRNTR